MITIAIDGPSAAGKTATAKGVANKLGILHLNTGALYRAIALYLIENNVNSSDEKEVKKHLNKINVSVAFSDGEQKTILNGVDVSSKLTATEVSKIASLSSTYKSIRKKMLNLQRNIAKTQSVIMEGRDITSVVLPKAKYKFYLTASAEVRAKRRLQNLTDIGETISFNEVLADIVERDRRDTSRKNNPLIVVKDAIVVNTDEHSLEEVIELICSYIK